MWLLKIPMQEETSLYRIEATNMSGHAVFPPLQVSHDLTWSLQSDFHYLRTENFNT